MKTEESEIYFVFDYASGEDGLKRCLIKNGVEIKVDIFGSRSRFLFTFSSMDASKGLLTVISYFFFFFTVRVNRGFFFMKE